MTKLGGLCYAATIAANINSPSPPPIVSLALMPGRQIPGRVAIFLDKKVPRRRTAQKINRTAEAARIITSPRKPYTRRIDGPPVLFRY